jgi:hypothetical protein
MIVIEHMILYVNELLNDRSKTDGYHILIYVVTGLQSGHRAKRTFRADQRILVRAAQNDALSTAAASQQAIVISIRTGHEPRPAA